MASYGPELIQIMRAVLEEVMTKIPVEQVTPGVKAHMAEVILKAAAAGQTSYDGLLASAMCALTPGVTCSTGILVITSSRTARMIWISSGP